MPESGAEEPRESCESAASGENNGRGISWSTVIQCRLRSAECAPRGCGEEGPPSCAVTRLGYAAARGCDGRHELLRHMDRLSNDVSASSGCIRGDSGAPFRSPSPPTTLTTHNGFHRFRHLQGTSPTQRSSTLTQPAHFYSRRLCTSPFELGRNSAVVSLFASFAIVFPPLGVALEKGCGADLCINIILVRRPPRAYLTNDSADVAFSDPPGLHVRLHFCLVSLLNSLELPWPVPESSMVRLSLQAIRPPPALTAPLL